ncbi:isocitrate lyase/PEP mutase family protein [Pseudooceanicola spongiae]|uniref:Isocitrate lyase/phosphoenolpyruvate mutase family protein n=1 Tax=Pseudooceanicola spongiae TaxID=2613965 RepID=A0A7L9WRD1_9RHOB|nr:isocitrate lyase/phosphoenolpyruvate mutase family protein [Pseudooceanicola spongiae]QOL82006.1 isocitrate lyase/phosphoenolpyruvate mutase family protein [Pseudooceanicola spongiae]
MTHQAQPFRALHIKGEPLVLYNIWDAGGAKALAESGAKAVATGSWSMAAAHGFEDGEDIPLDLVVQIVERIAESSDLPVTVDFEGGYAVAPDRVAENVRRIIQAGAVGINFEDQIVQGEGLYAVEDQIERIKAVRQAANEEGVDLFINARTDLFLGTDPSTHAMRVGEAIAREAAYKNAGADGFFVPGLTDHALIQTIVDAVSLPVNVMMMGELTSIASVADLGVSRVSYGPGPYINAMSDLKDRFGALK